MYRSLFVALSAFFMVAFATANVVIIGTRVIFPAEQKSVNVQLQNSSSDPALVQSWLDRGDINSRPNSIQVPFLVTPPVVRVEPNAGQTLRVVFTGKENLPQDRETLFYLNVLDVPPKPKAEDLGANTNYLQFAIRSRIKFFYRPALSLSPYDAYQSVQWRKTAKGVVVDNQTPYFITYQSVKLGNAYLPNSEMVAPFSSKTLILKGKVSGSRVSWEAINDFGGTEKGEAVLR